MLNNSPSNYLVKTAPAWTDNARAPAPARRHHEGDLLLASFHELPRSVRDDIPAQAGIAGSPRNLLARHAPTNAAGGRICLEPYEMFWLTGEDYANVGSK